MLPLRNVLVVNPQCENHQYEASQINGYAMQTHDAESRSDRPNMSEIGAIQNKNVHT